MEILNGLVKIGTYATLCLTLIAAALAVSIQNMFRAALALVLTLLGIAGIYFILHAEFLAAVQILLYVGAIMILVIFVVMLTSRLGDPRLSTSNQQRYLVLIAALLLLKVLIPTLGKANWNLKAAPSAVSIFEIAQSLMGPYVFPFEVISVVLVGALIGAVVIARSDSEK